MGYTNTAFRWLHIYRFRYINVFQILIRIPLGVLEDIYSIQYKEQEHFYIELQMEEIHGIFKYLILVIRYLILVLQNSQIGITAGLILKLLEVFTLQMAAILHFIYQLTKSAAKFRANISYFKIIRTRSIQIRLSDFRLTDYQI